MATLYKDGKECTADPHQIPAMEAAGWSRTVQDKPVSKSKSKYKPKADPTPSVDYAEDEG